jgi:hypothetical protein
MRSIVWKISPASSFLLASEKEAAERLYRICRTKQVQY